jgi:hypothetical protein
LPRYINEEGNKEPLTMMKIDNNYITRLEKHATRYKRSLSLEAEAKAEQEAQLEAIKVDIERLDKALENGAIQTITQVHENLATKLRRFNKGLEAIIDGERLSSDPLGTWHRKAAGLNNEGMKRVVPFVEEAVKQVQDPMSPLRKAVERAMELA